MLKNILIKVNTCKDADILHQLRKKALKEAHKYEEELKQNINLKDRFFEFKSFACRIKHTKTSITVSCVEKMKKS